MRPVINSRRLNGNVSLDTARPTPYFRYRALNTYSRYPATRLVLRHDTVSHSSDSG